MPRSSKARSSKARSSRGRSSKTGALYKTVDGARFRFSWGKGVWVPDDSILDEPKRNDQSGLLRPSKDKARKIVQSRTLPENVEAMKRLHNRNMNWSENSRVASFKKLEKFGQMKARCECGHTFPMHRNGNDRCHTRHCKCEAWRPVDDTPTYVASYYVYDPDFSFIEWRKQKFPHRFLREGDLPSDGLDEVAPDAFITDRAREW